MSRSERAIAEAAREAAEAVRSIQARREFTVSKFGRHPDGYLHARVVINGQPFYFHLRYGSWLAPGQIGSRAVLKEPEGLLGSVLGQEVKFTLAEKARSFRKAEQPKEDQDAGHERRVDDSAPSAPDLPDGGDRQGDHGALRAD